MAGVPYEVLTADKRRNLKQVALLVLDLIPKVMRRLATSVPTNWTPNAIRGHYMRCEDKMNKKLNLSYKEKLMFKDPGDGFINCDTSLLYKIIREYDLQPRPTQLFAGNTTVSTNFGDFVEILRDLRNTVVHKPHAQFTEEEMWVMKSDLCMIIGTMCSLGPNEDLQLHIGSYLSEANFNYPMGMHT